MIRRGPCESCVSCPHSIRRTTSPPTSSLRTWPLGRAFRETDLAEADLDTIVRNMISGEYRDPLRVVAFNIVEGWSRDVSEEIAYDVLDRAYDADTTLSVGAKRFIDRHVTAGVKRPSAPSVSARTRSVGPQEGVGRIDFSGRPPDTGAMGVRTRGLDIKAGAAKLKADRAARLEAELVVDRWNRRLATGRDMLWSPTIRAALLAGTPWLDVFCPGCWTSGRSTCGPSTAIRWPW